MSAKAILVEMEVHVMTESMDLNVAVLLDGKEILVTNVSIWCSPGFHPCRNRACAGTKSMDENVGVLLVG